jgi:hypothetical protein
MCRTSSRFLFALLLFPACVVAEEPYQVEWIRQIGTSNEESGQGIAADGTGIYVAGYSNGSLAGPNLGSRDAFLLKYDLDGNPIWQRQIGTTEWDDAKSVALDGLGSLYVGGLTTGNLGGPGEGNTDTFVSKYDLDGTNVWTRQLGLGGEESTFAVAADALGNVFFSGNAIGPPPALGHNGLVGRYDSVGALDWSHEFSFDFFRATDALGAATDGLGNVYLAGTTAGDAPNPMDPDDHNVFLAKYDREGNEIWSNHIESAANEGAQAIAVDAVGNAYITGFSAGQTLVSKYDAGGNHLWTDLNDADLGSAIAVDDFGNVFVTGRTGDLGSDLFVTKYDPSGMSIWTREFGSESIDHALGIAVDPLGNVYVTGETFGDLAAANAGSFDVFVARLSPVPEPEAILLAILGAIGTAFAYRKMRL